MNTRDLAEHLGVTYRQLDYWVRAGELPAVEPMPGSGNPREFVGWQVEIAERMAALVKAGVTHHAASQVANGDAAAFELLRRAVEANA